MLCRIDHVQVSLNEKLPLPLVQTDKFAPIHFCILTLFSLDPSLFNSRVLFSFRIFYALLCSASAYAFNRPYNLPVRYKTLFSKFASLMRYFNGRPHWAKSHDFTPQDFSNLLPHWDDFIRIKHWADPEGVFENPYIRRHLDGRIDERDGQRVFKSRL